MLVDVLDADNLENESAFAAVCERIKHLGGNPHPDPPTPAGLIERPDPTGTFGVHHGMICKLTSEGDSLWVRKYAWDDENFIGGFFRDMTTTLEGGFICTGTAYWSEDHPSQDTWVMKVDEYGCLVPGCQVGVIEKDQNVGFELYPNPAHDVLSAYIESKKAISGRFTLFNGLGQAALIGSKVWVSPQESVTYLFDIAHLPRGYYVLSFVTKNGEVISKKVVLE